MTDNCPAIPAVRFGLVAAFAVGTLICSGSSPAATSASCSNLSLARMFPVAELSEMLIARQQWRPFPTIQDRGAWQALPNPVSTYLVTRGEVHPLVSPKQGPLPEPLTANEALIGGFRRVFLSSF